MDRHPHPTGRHYSNAGGQYRQTLQQIPTGRQIWSKRVSEDLHSLVYGTIGPARLKVITLRNKAGMS